MAAKTIDGKAISAQIRGELTQEVAKLKKETGVTPGLAVVLVGDNPASKVYVGAKEKGCAELGLVSNKFVLAGDASAGSTNFLERMPSSAQPFSFAPT